MRFEYDSAKSASNLAKHGIDFAEAKRLWDDDNLAVIDARSNDEPRLMAIGRIGDHYWSAVFTWRSKRIRIISVEDREMWRSSAMKDADFDKAFDDGEDIDAFVDWSSLRRPNRERRRVEIELTSVMADDLDHQARSLGVSPQALVQRWVAEKLS